MRHKIDKEQTSRLKVNNDQVRPIRAGPTITVAGKDRKCEVRKGLQNKRK